MKTLVVAHAHAFHGEIQSRWSEFERQIMEALGISEISVFFTQPNDPGTRTVKEGLRSGEFRRILAVGGDGTASHVVNGFYEGGRLLARDAVLGILPTGRGNDFFRNLIPKDFYPSQQPWERGLALLSQGQPTKTDVGSVRYVAEDGVIEERMFINVASFGYAGWVVDRSIRPRGLASILGISKSSWIYLWNSLTGLWQYDPIVMEIRVDGQKVMEGPVLSGFVLNGQYNGGGMRWSQDAQIDDGIFHVVVIEAQGLLTQATRSHRMWTGDWKGVPGVVTSLGKKIEIYVREKKKFSHAIFELDGDISQPDRALGARFEVLREPVSVIRMTVRH